MSYYGSPLDTYRGYIEKTKEREDQRIAKTHRLIRRKRLVLTEEQKAESAVLNARHGTRQQKRLPKSVRNEIHLSVMRSCKSKKKITLAPVNLREID